MKKIIITIMAILVLTLGACAPQPAAAPENEGQAEAGSASLRVLAANSFLADIAQNVAGDRVNVASLIPIGMDPHAFEPTPQDVAKIADSQILIINGAGFEEWIVETIANAGGNTKVIEASAGLAMREAGENEPSHEHEHEEGEAHEQDDHSVESHSAMVCEQLEGKTAEEQVVAGADAGNATELHHHEEGATEHEHEREVINIKLTAQGDGTHAGFVIFDAEGEEGYAFTSQAGSITVSDLQGNVLEFAQELPLDCGGMSQGLIYKLAPGEYLVSLSGFATDSIPFSVAPIHAHEHEGEETADEHAAEGHSHEGDPHFWLDPNQVIKYVENIRDALSAADPEGSASYAENASRYIEQLRELDTWIRAQVEQIPTERRILVTDHDTMGYFADQYGLRVVGALIPSFSTGASPSAQELAELIDQIAETDAPAIFLDVAANPQLAEQIAAEAGVKVVANLHTHSVTAADGPAPTYIEMMRQNTLLIVEALK